MPIEHGLELNSGRFGIDHMKDEFRKLQNDYSDLIAEPRQNPLKWKNYIVKTFQNYQSHMGESLTDSDLSKATAYYIQHIDALETFEEKVDLFMYILNAYMKWQTAKGYVKYDVLNNGYDFPLLVYDGIVISEKTNYSFQIYAQMHSRLPGMISKLLKKHLSERETSSKSILITSKKCKIMDHDKDEPNYKNAHAEVFIDSMGLQHAYENQLVYFILGILRSHADVSVYLATKQGVYNMTVLKYHDVHLTRRWARGVLPQWNKIKSRLETFFVPNKTFMGDK